RARPRVVEHPAYFSIECIRVPEPPFARAVEQPVIRNTAPQKEREPRSQLQIADRMNGARLRLRAIPFRAKYEVRARESSLQRKLDPAFEAAVAPAGFIELQRAVQILLACGTPVCAPQERRKNPLRTGLFLSCVRRPANEQASAAWCVSRTRRMERTRHA